MPTLGAHRIVHTDGVLVLERVVRCGRGELELESLGRSGLGVVSNKCTFFERDSVLGIFTQETTAYPEVHVVAAFRGARHEIDIPVVTPCVHRRASAGVESQEILSGCFSWDFLTVTRLHTILRPPDASGSSSVASNVQDESRPVRRGSAGWKGSDNNLLDFGGVGVARGGHRCVQISPATHSCRRRMGDDRQPRRCANGSVGLVGHLQRVSRVYGNLHREACVARQSCEGPDGRVQICDVVGVGHQAAGGAASRNAGRQKRRGVHVGNQWGAE
mmetsp:Transcript_23502/g.51758  ORF Transcript_23502/g.51758 Transcript_23502/m.51758 type:complete len:274 (-) Transcript_23502:361-1182(-)